MNIKLNLLTTSIILVFYLLISGCGIFGGGKEEKQMAKELESKPVQTSTSPEPLPAAKVSSDTDFETDEMDYEESLVNGSLNWSKGFIRAKGFGVLPDNVKNEQQAKLMAFRAAYAEALSSLYEVAKGVQVTATTKVNDYVLKEYSIELKVDGVIKGAKEIARAFDDKENVAVVEVGIAMEDVAMSIPKEFVEPASTTFQFAVWEHDESDTLKEIAGDNDKLIETIENSENLEEIEGKLEKMAEDNKTLSDQNQQLLSAIEKLTKEIEELKSKHQQVEYTGIVINAAGSEVKPCMAPDIYVHSEDTNKLIYGIEDGRERDNNLHALVAWEKTISGAKNNPRVWENPLVINASHISKAQSAFAISSEDAKLIEKVNEKMNLLEQGKVVIVI
ncbi:hypothetical protein GF312_15715 [Candidatus Poribacteria bacterium]|nr:hypothetical protein [Candidatus Poribacteria bacterium]